MKYLGRAFKTRRKRYMYLAAVGVIFCLFVISIVVLKPPAPMTPPEHSNPSQDVPFSEHKRYPRIEPIIPQNFFQDLPGSLSPGELQSNDLAKYVSILSDNAKSEVAKLQACYRIATLDDKQASLAALKAFIAQQMINMTGGLVPASAGHALAAIGHLNTTEALQYLLDFRKTLNDQNDPAGMLRARSIEALANFTIEEDTIVDVLRGYALSDSTVITGLTAINTLAQCSSEQSSNAIIEVWTRSNEEKVKERIVYVLSMWFNMNNLEALRQICAKEPSDAHFGPTIWMHKRIAERALFTKNCRDFEGMNKEQIKTLLLQSLDKVTKMQGISPKMLDLAQTVREMISQG